MHSNKIGTDVTLTNILNNLRHKHEKVRNKALNKLKNHVEKVSKERSGEGLLEFIETLSTSIQELVNSSSNQDRIIAIRAIDILIEVNFEDTQKITRFSNYLRNTLSTQFNDPNTVQLITRTLGRLAKASVSTTSKTLTAEWVEFESKRALEWLEGDRRKDDGRRYASVLVLKELAENAPTLFYTHVKSFLQHIWKGIRDPSIDVREASVAALRAVLQLVSERTGSYVRVEWYHSILDEAMKGLRSRNIESIHGSILVIGELLRNTGNFMWGSFDKTCELVLKFSDHKDKCIKKSVITLIPEFSKFNRELFAKKYFDRAISIVFHFIKTSEHRAVGYLSLGEIILQMKDSIGKYLERIIGIIKDGISPRKGKPFIEESLTCLAMLGKAVGFDIHDHVLKLMDNIFSNGITTKVIESLSSLVEYVPDLLEHVQERLLDIVSVILAKTPYNSTTQKISLPQAFDLNSSQNIILALQTLGTFNMSGHNLADFVKDVIMKYLDDENTLVRKEAAITSCKLLITTKDTPIKGYLGSIISEVLEKLLLIAIADPDQTIRITVLKSLDDRFDQFLALGDNLRTLFIALNDESFTVRELAMGIIGRLSSRNPAFILPQLRKVLIQLLTILEFSEDTREKEEGAKMLGHLIMASPQLIKPYVPNILKVLMGRISDSNAAVSASVLHTTGKLALVGGEDIIPFIDKLLPLVIENLQDQSSPMKREVTVRTLGQLVQSTGYVVSPYTKYPKLLQLLLSILKSEESWSARREVMKVLGILGAIDPYKHSAIIKETISDTDQSQLVIDNMDILPGLSPSSEEYFPTVAINSLMRILKDPSLATHHTAVIQAVMFIFRSMGMKCVTFLPQIMPPFLNLIRTCEPSIRNSLFQQLSVLVSIVKRHIRNYSDEILKLIQEFWHGDYKIMIVSLIEELSLALNEEFKPFLSQIIPQMMKVLRKRDKINKNKYDGQSLSAKILSTLITFGRYLEDYLYFVVPSVMRLVEEPEETAELRSTAIKTIAKLMKCLNLSEYTSRIIHPLCRSLASDNQQIRNATLDALSVMIYHLKTDVIPFIPLINKQLTKYHIQSEKLDELIQCLLKNIELPEQQQEEEEEEEVIQEEQISEVRKMHVNQQKLKMAWEASQRTTKEDWNEWIRAFSVELLRESPSPALRACHALAQSYYPLARELFNAGFVSCWSELDEKAQMDVVRAIELAFSSPNLPSEILQTLLNLAEFMEHDDKNLPIHISALGTLSEKCQCYAKALHYKEIEFQENPTNKIEELISINNQLQQYEAAMGILVYAQKNHSIELKETWYEKLNRWQEALEAYEKKQKQGSNNLNWTLGSMRCMKALGEWDRLYDLCTETWNKTKERKVLESIAPMGAAASWYLGRWKFMQQCVKMIPEDSPDGTFYRAILEIHHENFEQAQMLIDKTRQLLDTELAALVGESYNRAYETIVRVQQLSEMEEIIMYKQLKNSPEQSQLIRKIWHDRLLGCQNNVDYWQNILQVRSLVLSPEEQMDALIQFSKLCRKAKKMKIAEKTLRKLIKIDNNEPILIQRLIEDDNVHPQVSYAYIVHMWHEGKRTEAFQALNKFVQANRTTNPQLIAQCYMNLGKWQHALLDGKIDPDYIPEILENLRTATEQCRDWYKSWHAYALMNNDIIAFYENNKTNNVDLTPYLVSAINGYFKSISLSPQSEGVNTIQDILRLLTLWFKYGTNRSVEKTLIQGFNTVTIDTWLQVIPQLIARIHTSVLPIRNLIHELLRKIGEAHPQALLYPLTVCTKSQALSSRQAAEAVLNKIRQYHPKLVDQAIIVSNELIRLTILWHEQWHEALEDASRLYFGDHDIDGMFEILMPLHVSLKKAETQCETAFQQAYGRELQEAFEWCMKYKQSKKEADLTQAWDIYYHVFRKIHKQLQGMITLDFAYHSPRLLECRDLELAVPGTYKAGRPVIRISGFKSPLKVISSKQRPRKLRILGSDGKEHVFLLKGHEDLRLDERVMQLFGLVNTLLATDPETSKRDLSITRYAVIPLCANAGIIEWVPNTDTFHNLIKEYRESRGIVINLEHRYMNQMAPEYDNLTLIQKIEVFEYGLSQTQGIDLCRVLWLKSRNSEVWLDRRTNYTRSLAVMSMVGYILGLGDRHPSNLMMEKYSGKVVHIDFGDCFEVAMLRDKYPEKIPFRLTRMLVNAMEVSGIEGTFRSTCESVMKLLRDNKHSLMAMLEAFSHDPLISWRLGDLKTVKQQEQLNQMKQKQQEVNFSRSVREKELRKIRKEEIDHGSPPPEVLNKRALTVMNRIVNKLTGRDFSDTEVLDVPEQVQRLIEQATSTANVCQCYIGWCPFW